MRFIRAAIRKPWFPAAVVTGVVALAFLAPVPGSASADLAGYGYANNCGVKGDGMHDHGKTCPNRPFPGKGKGVQAILSGVSPSTASENKTTTETDTDTDNAASETGDNTSTTANTNASTLGRSHKSSHGHGHGHGGGGD